jgi:predicted nucleotidyltransferase
MTNIVQHLQDLKLINPPKWVASNTHYLTLMGSMAYGCNKDDSDNDVYGFCMPPKTDIFPHLDGHIYGFGNELHPFEQYQQHHIMDTDVNKEYDLTVYSIVKYFNLLMGMNPNMVDSLFTPVHCIKHITEVGQMVRDNKTLFAHKGCYHKFRGYAYAQRAKMVGHERSNVKRKDCIDNFGYDLKYALVKFRKKHTFDSYLYRFGDAAIAEQKLTEYWSNRPCLFTSNIASEFFKIIDDEISDENIESYFHPKNKEFGKYSKTLKKYVLFDYVISKLNLCIEFNGDCFHANPALYKKDDFPNPFQKNLTSEDIWKYDEIKNGELINIGYDIIIIWESDYNRDKEKVINNTIKFIKDRYDEFKRRGRF